MRELLPTLGVSGHWKLKAPFDTQIVNGLAYTCRALNKLGTIVATGIPAYEEYYEKNNLSRDSYEDDLANDISIVTLLSSSGRFLFVPSTHIDGWPSNDVVPYVVMGMVAKLGALPNTVDPTFLKEKIDNLIKNALGHDPDVEFVSMSEVVAMPWVEHVSLERARMSMITDDNTDYTRRVKAEADLEAALVQVRALQKFIVDSNLVP